jgi:Zn finger protein HypA/HybF involved in hydrogenase expression
MTMDVAEMKVDGNAIGGLLREIFAMEMTAAETTCAGCGAVNAVGAVDVYMHAPGVVVRCPECKQVLMLIVHGRGRYWVDLRGVRRLEFAAPD